MGLNQEKIKIVEGIIIKFSKNNFSRKELLRLEWNDFLSSLNQEEKRLVTKIRNLDLKEYNIKTPFLGVCSVPEDLVLVRGQKYIKDGKIKSFPVQYLPKNIYRRVKTMLKSMKEDISEIPLITGYRSPTYQMILFLRILKEKDWSLDKTLKGVALPGYSEHSYLPRLAIDFIMPNIDSDDEEFQKTKQYRWLKRYAHKFNFYLSYPRNNKLGMKFEPWHWHYKETN